MVTGDGAVQLDKNVTSGTEAFLRLIGDVPTGKPVAFEAAFGRCWLAELLEHYGFEPHLVHPLPCMAIASARVKTDKADAPILAQLLRADLLPEAWIVPRRCASSGYCAAPGQPGPRRHPAAQPDPRNGRRPRL